VVGGTIKGEDDGRSPVFLNRKELIMPTESVRLCDVKPNPFRDLSRNPLDPRKIETLQESIRSTGWWGNILARRNRAGEVEAAYGHNRLEALRNELDPDTKIEVNMRKLSDSEMLQIMARENMEDWSPSLAMEIETVRAAVIAFAEGKVKLPTVAKDVTSAHKRYAPSFILGDRSGPHPVEDEVGKVYTANTLGIFLGWTRKLGKEVGANAAVQRALGALELEEQKIIEKNELSALTPDQATATVEWTKKTAKENGKSMAQAVANGLISQFTGKDTDGKPKLLVRDAAEYVANLIGRERKRQKPKDIRTVARELMEKFQERFTDSDASFARLEKILEFADELSVPFRHEFAKTLESLSQRILKTAEDMRGTSVMAKRLLSMQKG